MDTTYLLVKVSDGKVFIMSEDSKDNLDCIIENIDSHGMSVVGIDTEIYNDIKNDVARLTEFIKNSLEKGNEHGQS